MDYCRRDAVHRPTPRAARRVRLLAPFAVLALTGPVVAACAPAAHPAHASQTPVVAAVQPSTTPSPHASIKPTPKPVPHPGLLPPHVAGLTWTAAARGTPGGPAVYTARTAYGAVGLMWMDPTRLRFRFLPGLQVPEGSPRLSSDNRPSTWVPRMVAAFNGGFKLSDGVGGYRYAGRTVSPLRPGLATLTISSTGKLTVGAWGSEVRLAADTVVVRQNLPPLVDRFTSQVSSSDSPRTWGIANGGLWTANRSAVGELPNGSIVFAYGANVRPSQMAAAMVSVGARTAMMLDMNRSWPGGFVYDHVHGQLVGHRIQPGVYHDPSVYYAPYTKDFIVADWR